MITFCLSPKLTVIKEICLINHAGTHKLTCSVTKPRILNKKVETREPDFIQELRRGNMKEKWGLKLLHRTQNGRVELCVEKGKLLVNL